MKAAFLVGALAACATDSQPTLPSDAYFTGIPNPYVSVDECLSATTHTWPCISEVALCRSGAAGIRTGDVVLRGDYQLEGHDAVGALHREGFDNPFRLDLETDIGDNAFLGFAWQPDTQGRWMTLELDVIDCSQPK